MYHALIAATLLPQHSIPELRSLKQQPISRDLFVLQQPIDFYDTFRKKCISFECADGERVVSPTQFAAIQERSGTIQSFVKDMDFKPADGNKLPLSTVSTEQFDLLFGSSHKKNLSQKEWAAYIAAADYFDVPIESDIIYFKGISNAVLSQCNSTERRTYVQLMERIKKFFYFRSDKNRRSGWDHFHPSGFAQLCSEYVLSESPYRECALYRNGRASFGDTVTGDAINGVHGLYNASVELFDHNTFTRFNKLFIRIFALRDKKNSWIKNYYDSEDCIAHIIAPESWGKSNSYLALEQQEMTHLFKVGKKLYCIRRLPAEGEGFQWYSCIFPESCVDTPIALEPCAGVVLKESRLYVPKELAGDLECDTNYPDISPKNLPYQILPFQENIIFLADYKKKKGPLYSDYRGDGMDCSTGDGMYEDYQGGGMGHAPPKGPFMLFFNTRTKKPIPLKFPCVGYSQDFSEIACMTVENPHCCTIIGAQFTQVMRHPDKAFFLPYYADGGLGIGKGWEIDTFKRVADLDPLTAPAIWSKRFPHDEQIFNTKRRSFLVAREIIKSAVQLVDWKSMLFIAGSGVVAYKADQIFSFFKDN